MSTEVLMSHHMIAVSPASFETEVLKADLPVLVDFWAEWCAPCRVLAPQLERVASETQGKLKVVSLDAGAHADFAKQHGVTSLPTLILFKDGAVQATKVGATGGYGAVKQLIAPHLGTSS